MNLFLLLLPVARSTNVLFIIADDLGSSKLNGFTDPASTAYYLPDTPTLDDLRTAGITFTDVWSNPTCTTRVSAISRPPAASRPSAGMWGRTSPPAPSPRRGRPWASTRRSSTSTGPRPASRTIRRPRSSPEAGSWKLVLDVSSGGTCITQVLYELSTDPYERTDVAAANVAKVASLYSAVTARSVPWLPTTICP